MPIAGKSAVRSRGGKPRLSRRKKILFAVISCVGFLVCTELAIRIGAFFVYNRSPYFLLYGLKTAMADDHPETGEGHSAGFDGYFKFPPDRTLHQYGLFKDPTPIRINSLGFRGPDFEADKPDGIFRVICMGGSSTFGYFARDRFTYPALLERRFAERLPARKVEAINAGIPHADSDNLLAMLQDELTGYEPNVITIYTGFNDAYYLMDATAFQKSLRWIHSHFATYVAFKRLVTALGGPQMHSRWARYRKTVNQESVRVQVDLHAERYERNLRELLADARDSEIEVFFILQSVDLVNKRRKGEVRTTYAEEVRAAENHLQQEGWIDFHETTLLVQFRLMEILRTLAREENVPIVDNIAILDEHPEYFASYVHLTENGNGALADALFDAIRPLASAEGQANGVPESTPASQ